MNDSQLIKSLFDLAQIDSDEEENPVEEYATFQAAKRIAELKENHDRLIELLVKVAHQKLSPDPHNMIRDKLLLEFPEDYARIFKKMERGPRGPLA